MGDIAEEIRRGNADSSESVQIRKAFFGWYNSLPWFERKVGSVPIMREGTARLAAFNGARSRFGVDAVRQTLRAGATGADVVAWQKGIGAPQTGTMDPATIAATKAWQSGHGLKADGIVGAQSWGSLPVPKTAALASAAASVTGNLKNVGLVAGAGLLGVGLAFVGTKLADGKATKKK